MRVLIAKRQQSTATLVEILAADERIKVVRCEGLDCGTPAARKEASRKRY